MLIYYVDKRKKRKNSMVYAKSRGLRPDCFRDILRIVLTYLSLQESSKRTEGNEGELCAGGRLSWPLPLENIRGSGQGRLAPTPMGRISNASKNLCLLL